MAMKKLSCAVIVIMSATLGGCSGLQATSTMQTYIDQGAASAKARVSSTQPAADLSANAEVFATCHSGATVNVLSYWFGGKTVYANATIYEVLRRKDALANELSTRAAAGTLSADSMTLAIQIEAQYAANTRLQKDATAATASLCTVAKIKAVAKTRATSQPTSKTSNAASASALEELIASLPSSLQPWATEYGSALLRLGADEADAMIALLIAGDADTPYRAALSAMTESELLAEAAGVLTVDIAATDSNAQSVATQRKAALALASCGLSIILSLLGV